MFRIFTRVSHRAAEVAVDRAHESEATTIRRLSFWRVVCLGGAGLALAGNLAAANTLLSSAATDRRGAFILFVAALSAWLLGLLLWWVAATIKPKTKQESGMLGSTFGTFTRYVRNPLDSGHGLLTLWGFATLFTISAVVLQIWAFWVALD